MKGLPWPVIENQAEKNYVRGIGSQPGTVQLLQYALDPGAPRIDEDDFLRDGPAAW